MVLVGRQRRAVSEGGRRQLREKSGRREMDGWRNGILVGFQGLGNMKGYAEGRMEGAGQ